MGAYCSIKVSEESPFKNYLLDSTITSSGEENSKGRNNIYLINGKIKMKSINISYSKLLFTSIYTIYCTSNSNVTLSTFSNNTNAGNLYEAYHAGSSDSLEFKIFFCNYYENECDYFIACFYNLYINNCSFNKNNINGRYFDANIQIKVKGCYFDISDPGTLGNVEITENVSSIYPENYHLSSYKCNAKLKLKISKQKEEKFNKRNNKFNIMFCIFLTN